MNELFTQLANEAQIGLFEDKSFGWSVIAGTDQHLEKFAELIVRECIEQCTANDSNDEWDKGVRWAANQIREHFGVEE